MELQTTQVRIKKNCIIQEGSDGTVVWMTPSRAQLLCDHGAVEIIGSAQPYIGPSETKPAGPESKKSLPAAQDGPSIDSAASSEDGTAELQSSAAAAPASPLSNPSPLVKPKRGRPPKSR